MIIRRVHAVAFGPFRDEWLELADGLNVVTGSNESGKSTWHAAIATALCGRRRGRGGPRTEERAFAQRHRPWDGADWEVACVVELPDGRTVELGHDLEGRVRCAATDADRGVDLSGEVMFQGAPDGSRWLGLNRDTFQAVASVRQSQILRVVDDAAILQEDLQRAAATAGAAGSVAGALQIIDSFRREHVGVDRERAVKPLRAAKDRLVAAQHHEREVRARHAGWQGELERLAELRQEAGTAGRHLAVTQAAMAQLELHKADRDLRRICVLAEAHPSAPAAATDPRHVDMVNSALAAWEQRPSVTELQGPTAEALQLELDALPALPPGDLEPAPEVLAARDAVLTTRARRDAHGRGAPEVPDAVLPPACSPDEVRSVLAELEAPLPEVDDQLRAGAAAPAAPIDASAGMGADAGVRALLGGGLALVVAGIALVVAGPSALGLLVVGAGVVAGVVGGALRSRRRGGPGDPDGDRLASLEALLRDAEAARSEAVARRRQAGDRAAALGLPADPTLLRDLLGRHAEVERAQEERRRWEQDRVGLVDQVVRAEHRLGDVLAERGVTPTTRAADALEAAFQDYGSQCRSRAEQAREAARRPDLEQQVRARREAEARHRADLGRIDAAAGALRRAAEECGVLLPPDADPPSVDRDLQVWKAEASRRAAAEERARLEWTELQTLLDGRRPDEVEEEVRALASRARELAGSVPPEELSGWTLGADPADQLATLSDRRARLEQEVAGAAAALSVRTEGIGSVAAAVEEVAAAEAELARVRRLAEDLDTTQRLLEAAEVRVNVTIAPQLAGAVRPWLSRVTAGRYDDLRVDPADLSVQVLDPAGRWRPARDLSEGTAEQVYLLLRIALARLLTSPGASCPLLLDDVLVQSDAERSRVLLEVLREVSAGHQVVLFSQEEDVIEWARKELCDDDRCRHVELAAPPADAAP